MTVSANGKAFGFAGAEADGKDSDTVKAAIARTDTKAENVNCLLINRPNMPLG